MLNLKRLNIITGHYGSGKTNFAVNLALDAVKIRERLSLVDLDIVNPYFRAADSTRILEEAGIRVIAPIFANSNLDSPALPPAIMAVFSDRSRTVLLDVGGDDAGAAALGQFSKLILEENDFNHLYVINARRILTQTPEAALTVMREIEGACHLPVTAVVNNTNLCGETDPGIIRESLDYANEFSRLSGLPIALTAAKRELADSLTDIPDIFPVDIYVHTPWN